MTKLYGKDVLYDTRFLNRKQGAKIELQSLLKRDTSCTDIFYNDFVTGNKQ